MAANIYDLSTTAGSNTTIDGVDVSGATGKVKDGDNVMRSLAAFNAQWIDDQGGVATTAGTANAQTVTLASGFTAYPNNLIFRVKIGSGLTNTSSTVTINVNSIGTKTVKVMRGGALADPAVGDIVEGYYCDFLYDGTYLVLVNAGLPQIKVVRSQVFTSSGTYTPHANMVYCEAIAVGGGAGGGGCANSTAGNNGAAGGGGGGGASQLVASKATIGASQTVTIGAGGAGGTAGNNNGTNGGDTSVGSLCIGKGGFAGGGAASNASSGGGAGGVAGTGDFSVPGQAGGRAVAGTTATQVLSGYGGNSGLGFGAGGSGIFGTGTGTAGSNYGGGGAGGMSGNAGGAAAGGAGASGIVIIKEFCSA